MVELNLEEMKKIQLGILDAVADFCDKNQINYWLDSGTLIGAVRHKVYPLGRRYRSWNVASRLRQISGIVQ